TQLTIRWALWLPGYFAVYAPWLITKCVVKLLVLLFKIVGKTVAFAAAPLFKQLESIGETPVNAASEVSSPAKTLMPLPMRRIWLLLFFLWLVVFRGLDLWWAAWIAPALAVPVWMFFLKTAYQFAVTPKTFVTFVASTCSKALDGQLKMFKDAQEKRAKVTRA